MSKQALIARVEATIGAMIASGKYVGRSFNIPRAVQVVESGLPDLVTINGRQIRICGDSAEVLGANGAVVNTMALDDAKRADLLVAHAVSQA